MTEQIAWSIKSAALALDMPYAKVHEAVKSGRLPSRRLGSRYYVARHDAVAWFQALPAGTTSPKDD